MITLDKQSQDFLTSCEINGNDTLKALSKLIDISIKAINTENENQLIPPNVSKHSNPNLEYLINHKKLLH